MRCRACNTPLQESEIIWREELKTHEDLCLKCRKEVYDVDESDLEAIDSIAQIDYCDDVNIEEIPNDVSLTH